MNHLPTRCRKGNKMTNDECRMTNAVDGAENPDAIAPNNGLKYDLEERTATYVERVIDFALELERNPVSLPQTIARRTTLRPNAIFATRLDCAERNRVKRNIGFE